MRVEVTHLPGPADEPPPADVLVGADDDPSPRRHRVWAAAAVGAALVAGATVVDQSSPDAPVLALRAGELVPRDRVVDDRLAEARMHVEVVNVSDRPLDLRAASLVPGAWEVDVVDRTLLRPDESLVLSLHRTVVCDERASYGPYPEHLSLEARTDDEQDTVVRLPVADAYGGLLDDALRDPGRACVVSTGGGPVSDLVGSWRARRAWPPRR